MKHLSLNWPSVKRSWSMLVVLASASVMPSALHADALQQSQDTIASSQKQGQQSQQRVNTLDDKTQTLLGEYRQVKADTDQLALYNAQMERIVANQDEELSSLDRQIEEIENTERGILPLMSRMVDNLEQFVTLDVPFLPQERRSRIALLRDLLVRADVTLSEKFRRVLEAYQVELDYGRNIEAYRDQQDQVTYDFLRIGRTALYRLSNDGQQAWIWHPTQNDWLSLDDSYLRGLRKALKVAQQVAAPELLNLPLPTPHSLNVQLQAAAGGVK